MFGIEVRLIQPCIVHPRQQLSQPDGQMPAFLERGPLQEAAQVNRTLFLTDQKKSLAINLSCSDGFRTTNAQARELAQQFKFTQRLGNRTEAGQGTTEPI